MCTRLSYVPKVRSLRSAPQEASVYVLDLRAEWMIAMLIESQEGKHGADLPDDNPETVRMMLEWLYCKKLIHPPITDEAWHEYCERGCGTDYKVNGLKPVEANFGTAIVSDETLKHASVMYIKLYALACRLGLDRLREFAALHSPQSEL